MNAAIRESFIESLCAMVQSPFMQNAFFAACFASIACAVVGTLVVQSRLTFLAGGAAHAAYGGIGLAFHFSWPVLPATVIFSLGASLLMGAVSLKSAVSHSRKNGISQSGGADTAISVLWAAGMAFGIILIELTPGYAGELTGFLFGSILTVPSDDLLAMALFDGLLLLIFFVFRQGLWALCLDREFAAARGLPVSALYLLLVGITAVAVVLLIRVVGLILVLALLTIPTSLARGFCSSLSSTMLLSGVLSLAFCLAGLCVSWHTDISSGAAIIAVATIAYFAARLPSLGK